MLSANAARTLCLEVNINPRVMLKLLAKHLDTQGTSVSTRTIPRGLT